MIPEVLLLSFALLLGAVGIQITNLSVPPSVRNNSDAGALLDCEYTLKPDELAEVEYAGLVLKWYFNNNPGPVYQWIPGKRPQDLGILKGKLDLNYRASDHAATMYRALFIPNPTTELSGEYKCQVSTFADEDFMTKKMVVFAPGRSLKFTATKPEAATVNLTCIARGVYPEPKMDLYKESDRTKLEEVKIESISRTGSYDIVASRVVLDNDLETPTVFSCEMRIPEVSYSVTKNIVYYPGMFNNPTSDSGDAISCNGHFWMPLMTSLLTAYRACC